MWCRASRPALASKFYKTGKPVITWDSESYLIERFPQAETWLAAFGISDVGEISVAARCSENSRAREIAGHDSWRDLKAASGWSCRQIR